MYLFRRVDVYVRSRITVEARRRFFSRVSSRPPRPGAIISAVAACGCAADVMRLAGIRLWRWPSRRTTPSS